MNVCGATRLLVPSFLIAMAVSSVTGSDVYGWFAAGAAVVALVAVEKIRGTGASCSIAPPGGAPPRPPVSRPEPVSRRSPASTSASTDTVP